MGQSYGSAFAGLYDSSFSDFAVRVAPIIEAYYRAHSSSLVEDYPVLDLCCGTGQLANYFLRAGFQVVALDFSKPMLEFARANNRTYVNAGTAQFVLADAQDFAFDLRFGLVVSTFDALNHLPDTDALRRCFRCVRSVIVDGGRFIFDLNTRRGLYHWNSISAGERGESFLIQRGIYGGGRRAQMLITGFVPDGSDGTYRRFDEDVFNTAFDLADVEALLLDTEWSEVRFAGEDDLDAPVDDPESIGRVFVIATA